MARTARGETARRDGARRRRAETARGARRRRRRHAETARGDIERTAREKDGTDSARRGDDGGRAARRGARRGGRARVRTADAAGTTADEQRTAFEADKAAALESERGGRGRARRDHQGARRGARDREDTTRRDRGGTESSNNLNRVLGDRSLTVARGGGSSFRPLRWSRSFLSRLRSNRARTCAREIARSRAQAGLAHDAAAAALAAARS